MEDMFERIKNQYEEVYEGRRYMRKVKNNFYEQSLNDLLITDRESLLMEMITSLTEYNSKLDTMRIMCIIDCRVDNSDREEVQTKTIGLLQEEVLRYRSAVSFALIYARRKRENKDPEFIEQIAKMEEKEITPAYRFLRVEAETLELLAKKLNTVKSKDIRNGKEFIKELVREADRGYMDNNLGGMSWSKN